MHAEAYAWVARFASAQPLAVLDIGGRDINGSCRALFPAATYTVLDIAPGPRVDIVADAAGWTPNGAYDLVLCTEVFEHTPQWAAICVTACAATVHGGRFIATCAGPDRAPHSAFDGGALQAGEHYQNLTVPELFDVLVGAGFHSVHVERLGTDLRATGTR